MHVKAVAESAIGIGIFLPSLNSGELDPFHICGVYISWHSQRWVVQVYENHVLIG